MNKDNLEGFDIVFEHNYFEGMRFGENPEPIILLHGESAKVKNLTFKNSVLNVGTII